MRVVVIGGLGNFGARISRRLSQEAALEVIATSRQAQGANGIGTAKVATLDTGDGDFAESIKRLKPDLVIHCAGPFQGQDYRVALASLACGANYIDLSDGREFVAGFVEAVGPAARAAGRFAITGASTLPALSSAVVDYLKNFFAYMHAIDIIIAPGQQAPRGIATMTAVLGYAGKPFPWWEDGAWRLAHGWQGLKRERFSFGSRLAAACDVPDLELLPSRYPEVKTVAFRAALEVPVQHLGLWLLAQAKRMGAPLPIARWARSLNRVGDWLSRFGGRTGGMRVRIRGEDFAGREVVKTWELIAEDNHGPEIPCMAAVLLAIRSSREGLPSGARVCMGMLVLKDFDAEFARWHITTQISPSA
jgi:hypothetical protein